LRFQRVLLDEKFLYDPPADQVFLDDSFERRRIALAVLRTLGVDDGDRAAFTYAETIRFGAQDAALF
jgi:hypothetical protein